MGILIFLLLLVVGVRAVRSMTSWPAVRDVSCANCRYTVAYSRSRHCPECGADLLEAGVLLPDGRRHTRPRHRLVANLVLAAVPAVLIGVVIGQFAEAIEGSFNREPSLNMDGTQSIITGRTVSRAIWKIEASVHYRIRGNEVTYTHLAMTGEVAGGQTLETLTIPLPQRRFVLKWDEEWSTNGDSHWSGTIVPDPDDPNAPSNILQPDDLSPDDVLDWLKDASVDVADPQVIAEIEALTAYLLRNMRPDQSSTPPLEHFATVSTSSDATYLGGARPVRNIATLSSAVIIWILLSLIASRSARQWTAEYRRAAQTWLNAPESAESQNQVNSPRNG